MTQWSKPEAHAHEVGPQANPLDTPKAEDGIPAGESLELASPPAGASDPLLTGKAPVYADTPVYITTAEGVAHLAERLLQVKCLAVDLESDSLYHYYDKLCLLQLSAEGQDYIIDPLAVAELGALAPVFADRRIEKIFHAAENDLTLLHRCLGFEVQGIFDTQLAAQVVGHRAFSLQNLLAEYYGVLLDKKLQRHDWSLRPLLEPHLQYARSDTHYLEGLADKLRTRVQQLGRSDQLEEELEILELKRQTPREFNPDECLRLQGAAELSPKSLRVLRELFIFRDQVARQEDLPVFRIISHEALVLLSDRTLHNVRSLYGIPGLHPRTVKKHGTELIAAWRRASQGSTPMPSLPRREHRPSDAHEVEARFHLLRKWRQKRSEELGIELAMVASNVILHAVAAVNPRSLAELEAIPVVRRWQVRRFGEEWVTLLKRFV